MNLFEVYNNGRLAIVKSGSDFKEFSSLTIDLNTRLIDHKRVVVFDEELNRDNKKTDEEKKINSA